MFDIDLCNCESTHRKAVARWRITHPQTRDLPYGEVVQMVNMDRIEREGRLTRERSRHPGDMTHAIFNRRLFDPDRYLRNNDGRQPQEIAVITDEGTIYHDLNYIPTLDYATLPVNSEEFRGRAFDLLLQLTDKSLEQTLLLKAIYDTRSLRPCFDPIYKAAGELLPYFDPLCSNCPVRRSGGCNPLATMISAPEQLQKETSGFVEIQRRLIFHKTG